MAKRTSNLLTAEHPTRGLLWAAFDPCVHHIVGKVGESRWAARLAPFKSRAEAEAALLAEGCALDAVAV
jgi:hypothetical protein